MADNNDLTINGIDDDSAVIDFNHSPAAKKTDDLDHLLSKIESLENKNHESNRRIEDLESENDSLSKSNLSLLKSKDDAERKIEELESEIEALREEIEMVKKEELERADEERKAVDSIVKRVGELESKGVRLQHDLAASEKAAEEAERLRGELEKLRGEKGRMEEEVRDISSSSAVLHTSNAQHRHDNHPRHSPDDRQRNFETLVLLLPLGENHLLHQLIDLSHRLLPFHRQLRALLDQSIHLFLNEMVKLLLSIDTEEDAPFHGHGSMNEKNIRKKQKTG